MATRTLRVPSHLYEIAETLAAGPDISRHPQLRAQARTPDTAAVLRAAIELGLRQLRGRQVHLIVSVPDPASHEDRVKVLGEIEQAVATAGAQTSSGGVVEIAAQLSGVPGEDGSVQVHFEVWTPDELRLGYLIEARLRPLGAEVQVAPSGLG
jgi:hypothetical protein